VSRFTPVPPAVVPTNQREIERTDREIRLSRARQAVFERGIALALVMSMQESLTRLEELKSGLRWVLRDEEVAMVRRWLERLEDDIHRGQRIQEGDRE
jgi:hypothetical protein